MKRQSYSTQQGRQFTSIFGRNLKTFWSGLFGFDLVKFDDEIVKPGKNESTEEAIRRQWGEDAVALIWSLL